MLESQNIKIEIFDGIDEHAKKCLFDGLGSYNDKFAPLNKTDFTIAVKDIDVVVGVAMGESFYDWLFLKYLWIKESYRRKGLGLSLINKVEDLAKNRKLIGIHLDTFEFQARDFYEKAGYKVFGEIEDHPLGYKRYFMKKCLLPIKPANK